jgi:tetratricopeptide (TPR) repeat protein
VEKLALLPFDNVTGDASLDWVRNAGPAILSDEFVGSARVVAFRAASTADAILGGATRMLHCTFSKRGNNREPGGSESESALRFEYSFEDVESHKMAETGVADGAVLFAANTLARKLDPAAKPFSTARPDAVTAWGHGEFERAIASDPDFGAAWSEWVTQLARSGKPELAIATAERALARASLRTPYHKARLQYESAVLRKDAPAQIAALTALSEMAPRDPTSWLSLAAAEQAQRDFAAAAGHFRKVLALQPANAGVMNTLGYAEGGAGNLEAAKSILESYGRQPGQETNSLDSLGEVHFMNGRFVDAEKYFLQVTTRDPGFLQGRPLLKAAYAHWLSGDLPGADAIARRYFEASAARNDPNTVWREATWLYVTGRTEPALKKLDSAPAAQKVMLDRQRLVWRGQAHFPGLAQIKAAYFATDPSADGFTRVLYAAALAQEGKTEEARALLKRWPLPEAPGEPLLQSNVFPQFLVLRQKLGVK